MFALRNFSRPAKYLLWLCVLTPWASAYAQQPTPSPVPPRSTDDVVRVYTELVQTDVMVFDKQGRFVKDLTRDNFEIRIDGKPRPIEAFELITAGSNEESQLAAARGAPTINLKRPVPLDRGRIVFFYVDDFHMDLSSMVLARKTITHFIEKEMGQNDQAAIASATGQIGFLQQLTSDRTVLHAALERLKPRTYSVKDMERPPMTEYQALLIERNDRSVFEFFISETIRANPGITRDIAAHMVRGRASAMMAQGAQFNSHTLVGLERLIRTAKDLPGRKVVFFLSGGFLIENRRGDAISKLRDVTSAAARSGVVIYSLDARGLVTGMPDASSDVAFDPTGQLLNSTRGELTATQDGMHALAADTGGKALFNTNDLTKGLAPALNETAVYYLLAWKPDADAQKEKRFRNLEVRLVNRSDLNVRVRKGYLDVDPEPAVAAKPSASPTPASQTVPAKLRESIAAAYPERDLPILMSADYYDVSGQGATLSTAVQIPIEFLVFSEQPDGKHQAAVDVSGVFYDDKGVPKSSFMERIVATQLATATSTADRDITFTYPAKLAPGLHQVRVAVRDAKSGRVGSAHAWFDIPDLTKKKLTISSLLLGERTQSSTMTNISTTGAINPVALSGSHRFRRDSTLRFLVFAYNAALAPADQKPDVAIQVQVVRDDQPVVTTALRKIAADNFTDLTRLPYAAEIPLSNLQPGRYLLQVSVIDRVSKQSTTRTTHFDIY
ncbi:MAG TPA: VWA domain-containing protein [Pyrinomonadaceae bacterium]|nr:VWA domain-containing protein [Pyrinomonadaceae bacterium]